MKFNKGTKQSQLIMAPEFRRTGLLAETEPPADSIKSAVLILIIPPNPLPEGTFHLRADPNSLSAPQIAIRAQASSFSEESFPLEECSILLIKRSNYKGAHSNEIGFPGGKIEPTDASIIDAALREAEEEIGLNPSNVQILGELLYLYVPPSNFTIYPILGILHTPQEFKLNSREIADYKIIPLSKFLDPTIKGQINFKLPPHLIPPSDTLIPSVRTTNCYSDTPKSQARTTSTAPTYQIDETCIWGATAMLISSLINQ